MIDLSLMRGVHVDAGARTATVDGGCLLGDIDRATGVYGWVLRVCTMGSIIGSAMTRCMGR